MLYWRQVQQHTNVSCILNCPYLKLYWHCFKELVKLCLSRCGLQLFLSRGHCHLLLGLKQGYPLYSPYGCRLGYHQTEAWPVEQKALPPKFYVASVTTGTRTHTLLIKQQSLNPVHATFCAFKCSSLKLGHSFSLHS